METTPLSGEITGTVLLYSRPEPLSVELHGKLGMKRSDRPFGFAARTHLIPLTVTEFSLAALSYPVIFVGDDRTPVGAMGLRDGENLFISEDGLPDPDMYVPAYIRRYPFVFANDESAQRMILCIDRGASGLDENGGDTPLFEGTEPSAFTQSAMEFCREFETERRRTEDFVKLLTDLDLFEVKQAFFTPRDENGQAGEPQQVAEYFAVSEEKLGKLPADKAAELLQNGALAQIYAHLISLLGWDRVVMRAIRRAADTTQVAGNA